MSRGREIELPAEALALIEQVRSLEQHAEETRHAVTGDLVGIVKNAETERAQAAEGVVAAQRDVEAGRRSRRCSRVQPSGASARPGRGSWTPQTSCGEYPAGGTWV
jgi:hypothetical protein